MVRTRALLLLLVGCAAESKPPPVKDAKVVGVASGLASGPASGAVPAAAPAGPRTVTGAWFSLVVPAEWEERPSRNDAERGVSEGMWRTPRGVAPVNILVARPVPFAGDAAGFAAQSLFAFTEAGMGTMAADGEADLGGVPARRYRGTLAMMGKTREVAYWFFVHDGSGLALQCGGEGPQWFSQCVEIVASFRVTGAVPPVAVALPAATVSLRELPGYTAELRDDWQMFSTVQHPDAVFQLRAVAPAAGMFPGAVLRRRPWTGGKLWSADFLAEITALGGRELGRNGVIFLAEKASMLEVELPPQAGGYRALVTGVVRDGMEIRLSCVASPLVMDALRPDCLRLIATLAPRA